MSDPWAAFPDAPKGAAADPWAAFPDAPSRDTASLQRPSGSAGGPVGDEGAAVGRGIINGVPVVGPALLSSVEHAGASLRSLALGTPYDDELKGMQDFSAATAKANPKSTIAGEIAGGVLGTAPMVAAAPAAFGAGAGALAGRVAAGAASSAVLGGTDAAVRSGGDGAATFTGAALGGVAGAAGPAIATGAQRVLAAGGDYLAQSAALRGVGVSRPAAEVLTNTMAADGTLGGQGAANIAAAGPEAMLADAGPGARNVLDTAMQRGGPGAVAAREAIDQRAGNAETNIAAALDRHLGAPRGLDTTTNAIREGSADARSTAYDAAYNSHIDYDSPQGQAIRDTLGQVPNGMFDRANRLMQVSGESGHQLSYVIDEAGQPQFAALPNVRQLDYVKRAVQDVAQRGDGQGALGGNTAEGRAYGNLASRLRDVTAAAAPEYQTALDTAATPMGQREALDFGSTLLSPSTPRDVAADTWAGLNRGEQPYARQGVRSAIDEKLANVKRTITDPNVDARQAQAMVKDFSSDAAREKLGMILPVGAAGDLNTTLDQGARALDLRASAAGNSRTYARLATQEGVDRATEPGILGRFAAGEPIQGGQALAQLLTGTRPIDRTHAQDAIYGEILNALTGPRGQQALDLAGALQRAHATRMSVNSKIANLPVRPAVATGASMLAPLYAESR